MPASLQARITRTAISPRLAIRTFCKGVGSGTSAGYRPAQPPERGDRLTGPRSALDLQCGRGPSVGVVENLQIAVLGTGPVGRAVAGRLAELGHSVTIGTRD